MGGFIHLISNLCLSCSCALTRIIRSDRWRRRILFRPSKKRINPSKRDQSPLPERPSRPPPAPSPYTSQWPSPSATRLAPPAGSSKKRVRQNFKESIRLWKREEWDLVGFYVHMLCVRVAMLVKSLAWNPLSRQSRCTGPGSSICTPPVAHGWTQPRMAGSGRLHAEGTDCSCTESVWIHMDT